MASFNNTGEPALSSVSLHVGGSGLWPEGQQDAFIQSCGGAVAIWKITPYFFVP